MGVKPVCSPVGPESGAGVVDAGASACTVGTGVRAGTGETVAAPSTVGTSVGAGTGETVATPPPVGTGVGAGTGETVAAPSARYEIDGHLQILWVKKARTHDEPTRAQSCR